MTDRRLLVSMLVLLAACKHRSYATSEGTASVVLTPIDGEGYTIEAHDLVAYGSDNWDQVKDRYDDRVVYIQGSIAPPGPCFADSRDVLLEVDLYATPQVFIEIVPVGPENVLAIADEYAPAIRVDAWSGDSTGEVEFFYGDDDSCERPATRHTLEVHWTLDEDTWTEVKQGVGDIWPPVPAG
jgi:hypothetical protein